MLVLPSRQEPFDRSLIEAMALRTPVVASPVDGIVEIVENDSSGLLVEVGDARALADAIVRLAEDPTLRAQLADTGLAVIRARFDVADLTRRLE